MAALSSLILLWGKRQTDQSSCNFLISSLVWALSAVTLGALLYFNYTDVGIINAIKMLWKL